jgi:hypothetical protein
VEREPSAATALLGLSGFALPAVSGYDGELEQAVETTANLVGCPGRSAVTTRMRRRARCVTCRMRGAGSHRPRSSGSGAAATGSVTTTWTESSEAIAPGASWTEPAGRGRRCG